MSVSNKNEIWDKVDGVLIAKKVLEKRKRKAEKAEKKVSKK